MRSISAKSSAESVPAAAGNEGLERSDDPPVALADELLRVARILGEPRARRRRRIAPVLAGEEAAGEREIGQDAEAARLRGRKKIALDVAHQQAVLVLAGDECRQTVPLRRVLRRDHLLRRQVRAADESHLALADEIIERTQGRGGGCMLTHPPGGAAGRPTDMQCARAPGNRAIL